MGQVSNDLVNNLSVHTENRNGMKADSQSESILFKI